VPHPAVTNYHGLFRYCNRMCAAWNISKQRNP
jgi:hypothetical protein